MPTLTDLSVKTLGELEDVVDAVLEKALENDKFCHVYADVCIKLEDKCVTKNMVKTFISDGLVYPLLEETPPRQVAGPFESKEVLREAVQKQSEILATLWDPPADLQDCNQVSVSSEVFRVWHSKQDKYYVSRGLVMGGPYKGTAEAMKAVGQMHPVRLVLLRRCQRELDVNPAGSSAEVAKQVKHRKIGTCRFLGALFRRGFVERSTVYKCIEMLLNARENIAGSVAFVNPSEKPDEINWEALCTLFESTGSLLESPANDSIVSKYFWLLKLKLRALSPDLTSRVQAVIDLRAKGWDADAVEIEKACSELAQVVGSKRARTA